MEVHLPNTQENTEVCYYDGNGVLQICCCIDWSNWFPAQLPGLSSYYCDTRLYDDKHRPLSRLKPLPLLLRLFHDPRSAPSWDMLPFDMVYS